MRRFKESPEEVLTRELLPGEHLLWCGRPKQGYLKLYGSNVAVIMFLTWCCLVLLTSKTGTGTYFSFRPNISVIVFISFPFTLFWGGVIYDKLNRGNSIYGVTNLRLLIISGVFRQQKKFVQVCYLTDIEYFDRTDRSGTICFGSPEFPEPLFYSGPRWRRLYQYSRHHFFQVDNAREVYHILLKAVADASNLRNESYLKLH